MEELGILYIVGSPHGMIALVLDCGLKVSKFKL